MLDFLNQPVTVGAVVVALALLAVAYCAVNSRPFQDRLRRRRNARRIAMQQRIDMAYRGIKGGNDAGVPPRRPKPSDSGGNTFPSGK